MIKIFVGTSILLSGCFLFNASDDSKTIEKKVENTKNENTMNEVTSLYDIKINDINGNAMDLNQYKGKKILFVNVASECGYTPQYKQLQELYESSKDVLVIIGCPSNDFGGQEPGSGEEIVTFCKKNYGVTFPLTEKVGIKSNTHPLYQWLTQKSLNGKSDNNVAWNFSKFLVNANGDLEMALPSAVTPLDEKILSWVKS
jgi:glutathione peroxidase